MLILDPTHATPVPWRNGAGTTRVLCDTDRVRVSVADLVSDASFSPFPGLDRLFILLAGEVVLDDHRLTPGDELRFPGESKVAVVVRTPGRALNVMTTRGLWRAEVRLTATPTADTDIAVALGGERFAEIRLTPERST